MLAGSSAGQVGQTTLHVPQAPARDGISTVNLSLSEPEFSVAQLNQLRGGKVDKRFWTHTPTPQTQIEQVGIRKSATTRLEAVSFSLTASIERESSEWVGVSKVLFINHYLIYQKCRVSRRRLLHNLLRRPRRSWRWGLHERIPRRIPNHPRQSKPLPFSFIAPTPKLTYASPPTAAKPSDPSPSNKSSKPANRTKKASSA